MSETHKEAKSELGKSCSSTAAASSDEKDAPSSTLPQFQVLSTYSPIPWLHPTQAVLQDTSTGEIYDWNSRAHRKLRDLPNQNLSKNQHHNPRLWCFEPYIVTWWMNITNIIANIFWTVSGVYATWPSSNADASGKIVYAAGILAGVFMICSCYLSYVEAMNQSNVPISKPCDAKSKKKRKFIRSNRLYGRFLSPIGVNVHGVRSKHHEEWMHNMGYPRVENTETGEIMGMDTINSDLSHSVGTDVEEGDHDSSFQSAIGTDYNVRLGHFVVTTRLLKVSRLTKNEKSYEWWTWHPPVDQLGVVLALIGFVSAIVYLIPMCAGWPLAQNDNASVGVTVFFVDVLQVIPYICFAFTCHAYIAEAAGSWWKPKLNSIGYWACLFNLIGAYGFLMCGALAIPVTLGSTCCPNMSKWGSAFACFWGSVTYLIGGLLQWVEFANPEPIVFGNKHKDN